MSNAASSAAARVAETDRQHISPSPTPSKNVTASGNPELSQAVRDQWNIPNEENTKPKANLQDVQNIGQSLKEQGVTTSEGLQPESKAQMENRFDNNNGTSSSVTQAKPVSETDKVTQLARQSIQKESQSQGWER